MMKKMWSSFSILDVFLSGVLVALIVMIVLMNPFYLFEPMGTIHVEADELIDVLEHAQREYVFEHEGGELRVTLAIDDLDALRGGQMRDSSFDSFFGLTAYACGDFNRTLIKSASACVPTHRIGVPFEGTLEGVLSNDGEVLPFRKRLSEGTFSHYGQYLYNGLIWLEVLDGDTAMNMVLYWNGPEGGGEYIPLCFDAGRVSGEGRVDVVVETECPTFSIFGDDLDYVRDFVSKRAGR